MNEQKEKWIRWEPVAGLHKRYYVDGIHSNFNGFKIIFGEENDPKKTLHMIFSRGIQCFRETNESYIYKSPFEQERHMHDKDYWDWTFFKVTNSDYLKWLSNMSCGVSEEFPIIHFSFLSVESMLDVIATYEPTFEFVEKK